MWFQMNRKYRWIPLNQKGMRSQKMKVQKMKMKSKVKRKGGT